MPRRAELVGIVRPEVDDQELDRQASKMEQEFEGAAKLSANIDTRKLQRKLEQAIPGGSLLGTAVDTIARGGSGGGATTAGGDKDASGGAAGVAGSGAMLKYQEEQVDKLEDIHDILQQGGAGAAGGGGGGGGSGLLQFGLGTLLGKGGVGGKAKGLASVVGSLFGKGKSLMGGLPKIGGGGGALAPIGLPSQILGNLESQDITDVIPDDMFGGGGGGGGGTTTAGGPGGTMTLMMSNESLIQKIIDFEWPSLPSLPSPSSLVPDDWSLPSASSLIPDDWSLPAASSIVPDDWSLPSPSSLVPDGWSLPSASSLVPDDWSLPSASSLVPDDWELPTPGDLIPDNWNLPSPSDFVPDDWNLPGPEDLPSIEIPRPDWLSAITNSGEQSGDGNLWDWEGASGGVVTGPTNALIGEGREDEAVMPLSALEGTIQQAAATGARSAGGQPGGRQRRPNPFLAEPDAGTTTPDQPTQVDAQMPVSELSVTLQADSLDMAVRDAIDQLRDEVVQTVTQQVRNEMEGQY